MDQKTLYLHSRGQPVRALQLLLKKYEPGLAVDGIFGPRTERAVRAAQRKLEIVPADGIAGPYTLAALTRAAKGAQPANPSPPPPQHPSFGQQFNSAVHNAGHAISSTASSTEHAVVNTIEEAVTAIEKFIAGLHPEPHHVPANTQHVVQPGKNQAKNSPNPPSTVRDPKTMRVSPEGRAFVFWWEARDGKATSTLHLPTSGSGITLGPGYDMGARKPAEVKATMLLIGVDPTMADIIAGAAGKWGEPKDGKPAEAQAYITKNKHLVYLTVTQQQALEDRYQAPLGKKVRQDIHVPLHQYEFDALLSFSGNSGKVSTGRNTTARLINEHKPAEAAAEIMKYVRSGKVARVDELMARREAETAMLLYGDYLWARHAHHHHFKTSASDKDG